MKKLLLVMLSISWLGLSAQTPTVVQPSSTGVSDAFRNYAKKNPKIPVSRKAGAAAPLATEEGVEMEIPNQFYIPRGSGPVDVTTPAGLNVTTLSSQADVITLNAAVTPAPSTMFNQTTNGTLPVTQRANYVGLGNGFNAWTNQGLLPPDTTMAVGAGQIVQWVNLRLTVLDKATGALKLGGSDVNGNQIWAGLGAAAFAQPGIKAIRCCNMTGRPPVGCQPVRLCHCHRDWRISPYISGGALRDVLCGIANKRRHGRLQPI